MRVTENPEAANRLLARAERALDAPRVVGVHVSDLVSCLRKYYYNQTEQRVAPSPETRAIFLLGKTHHVMLQAGGARLELPVLLDLPAGQVHGTVDEWDDVVSEIKTTRSHDIKEPAFGMPQYIEQLAAYCLSVGVSRGRLIVWYIFAMPPVLRVWDIEFTGIELVEFKNELGRRLTILAQNDIPDIGEHRRGECESCPYWRRLKKGDEPCEGDLTGGRENFFLQSNYTSFEGTT